jgi:hypothetical protein
MFKKQKALIQNRSGFERIDDGRLEEEQPGTVWAPKGGERVALDTDDGFDSSITNLPPFNDTDNSGLTERIVTGLIDKQFDPKASQRTNLENCVEYLSSEQFIHDLARGHV